MAALTVKDLTAEQREKIVKDSKGLCAYCGRPSKELTLDHIVPVSQGGNHTLDNITVACKSCNSRKWVWSPEEAGMRARLGVSVHERWGEAKDRIKLVFLEVPAFLTLEFGLPGSEINNRMYRHLAEDLGIEGLEWVTYLLHKDAELYWWIGAYSSKFHGSRLPLRHSINRLDIELLEDLAEAYEVVGLGTYPA